MISQQLECVREKIAMAEKRSGRKIGETTLIAVTKTHGPDMINEAIRAGVEDIGENRVQEILDKYEDVLPVRWHLIGHLQTNKVKYIIDKVSMIHSVDSIKLLDEIERQAELKNVKCMDVLIEMNISGEESKFGVTEDDLDKILEHGKTLSRVRIQGLMTVAPRIDDKNPSNTEVFKKLKAVCLEKNLKYVSMGMSGDYEEATECGADFVRVGSAIFGERGKF